MSLDVHLISRRKVKRPAGSGIFVRENGQTIEISEEEWQRRHPDREPVRFQPPDEGDTNVVFSWNITHNLAKMADKAGLYMALWKPEELNYNVAHDLIDPLRNGLARLKGNREHYQQYNPDNGWGDYEGLVEFVQNYLTACRKHPTAKIEVSR
jgi:hypothetical protein